MCSDCEACVLKKHGLRSDYMCGIHPYNYGYIYAYLQPEREKVLSNSFCILVYIHTNLEEDGDKASRFGPSGITLRTLYMHMYTLVTDAGFHDTNDI